MHNTKKTKTRAERQGRDSAAVYAHGHAQGRDYPRQASGIYSKKTKIFPFFCRMYKPFI